MEFVEDNLFKDYLDFKNIIEAYIMYSEQIELELSPELDKILNLKGHLIPFLIENNVRQKTIVDIITYITYVSDKVLQEDGFTYNIKDIFNNIELIKGIKSKLLEIDNKDIYSTHFLYQSLCKEFVDSLNKDIDSGDKLVRLIKTKTRGNDSSLVSAFLSIGYKIDNDSSIINDFIEENLFEGVESPINFYNSGIGSRNALLQSVNSVSESGYLTRKLNFLCKEVDLSGEDYCGSKGYLDINLTNENIRIFDNRYFYTEAGPELVTKEHIGKFVKLLTPISCHSEGYSVCKKCYGDNHKNLEGYSNIGLFSSSLFGEKITQTLLSSKHLQAIIFADLPTEFSELFEFDFILGGFKLKTDSSYSLIMIDDKGTMILNDKYEIKLPFKTIYINDDSVKVGDLAIEVSVLDLQNSDMNSLISMMNQIFDKSKQYTDIHNINEYYTEIFKFLKYANINVQSIHTEIILMCMSRLKSNIQKVI